MDRRIAFLLLAFLMLACAIPTAVPSEAPPIERNPTETSLRVTRTPTTTTEPLPRPPEVTVCGGEGLVALLVDPALASGIRAGLDQFESDLCLDGYGVVERRADFAGPPEVRGFLSGLYGTSGGTLAGAILIGSVPRAYQQVVLTYSNPSIPPLVEEVISFQYYADLDGTFHASAGYVSLGGHEFSYDVHEGDLDWEIWVSALPVYQGSVPATIEAINRYFEKNHAFRSGAYDIPRGFMEIDEHAQPASTSEDTFYLNELASGQYAWTPLSSAPDARLYIDSFSGTLTTDRGYLDLAAGVADISVLAAHGYYLASGNIDVDWIEANGLRTVLLWSDGCAVGNLDHPENFLTSALYDPASRVLIAKGTTNDSGGLGTNGNGFYGHNIATGLNRGLSLGAAVISHVNTPLIHPWSNSREFHFASVLLLGDPTLQLRP